MDNQFNYIYSSKDRKCYTSTQNLADLTSKLYYNRFNYLTLF